MMNDEYTKYGAHFRNSALKPRFFLIDARASLLFLFFIVHIRLWTFMVALIGISFLAVLEYFGFTLEIFLRWMRNRLAGSRKSAIPWWIQYDDS